MLCRTQVIKANHTANKHLTLVVLIQEFLGGHLGLHGRKLVSLGFETRHNVSNDSTLNTIGLDLYVDVIGAMNQNVEIPPMDEIFFVPGRLHTSTGYGI